MSSLPYSTSDQDWKMVEQPIPQAKDAKIAERPTSRPVTYESKSREPLELKSVRNRLEPLKPREAVRSKLVARHREEVRKRPAPREATEAKTPKLSRELQKKIADAQNPVSDGYELNQMMSKALESELQEIMLKAWEELPDIPSSEAEALVTDKFRNEAGQDLKHALGLNVTKRILNVANPFSIKIEFDTQPYGPCALNFLRWLNCANMKRTLDGQHTYRAVLPSQSDFDRVLSKPVVRIGTLKAKMKPHYRFTKCPPKLKTIYKCSKKKMPDNEQEIIKEVTDLNIKLDAPKAEVKKTTAKTEVKKEVKKPAEVKTEAKKSTEVKAEAKKPTVVKTEAKKPTEVKTETKKPTEVKTENKPSAEVTKTETPKKVEATVKTESKPAVTPKTTNSKTTVTKVTPKSQAAPKKPAVSKPTPQTKPKDNKTATKVAEKTKTVTKKPTASKTTPNKKKQRKQSDFDELDDEDILALMSNAIVLDECVGSDDD
ncbi:titin-like isoform X2 [Phthorimaea operculella]|nr:titin-like isoform X2 [Phthorimaea operculella]